MGAAGKEYPLMTEEDIYALPIKQALADPGVVFSWATAPKLDLAIHAIERWGLHFRGVAHNWVKTTKAGEIIHGQGTRPTYSKPLTEYLLLATTCRRGRPFPLLDEALPHTVLHPRLRHSEKPQIFRDLIEAGYGKRRRLEIFARSRHPGWHAWGNELCQIPGPPLLPPDLVL